MKSFIIRVSIEVSYGLVSGVLPLPFFSPWSQKLSTFLVRKTILHQTSIYYQSISVRN